VPFLSVSQLTSHACCSSQRDDPPSNHKKKSPETRSLVSGDFYYLLINHVKMFD